MHTPATAAERELWEAQLSDGMRQLQATPNDLVLQRVVGRLMVYLGRFDEACRHLRRALEAEPRDAESWYYLGWAAADLDDRATLREALERFESLASDGAQELTRRALLHAHSGDPREAVRFAERALATEAEPKIHAWAHRVLARCLGELGELREQLLHIEAAMAISPARARDVAEMAHLQYRLGRPVTVMPVAEALVVEEPENAEAWYALGVAANRQEDWRRAQVALERAQALHYDFAAGLERELGTTLGRLGRYQAGIEALESALSQEQPADAQSQEQPADAQSWIHCSLGYFHSCLKQPEQALSHYQAAVELDPASTYAQQGLGAVYFELGDTASARRHLERAAQLAPDQEHPWYALGSVLAWAGELDPAVDALRRSITLGRADGKARARLARVYQQQGKWRLASKEATHALRQPLPKKWRTWVADIANQGAGRRR